MKKVLLFLFITSFSLACFSLQKTDKVYNGFRTPPDSAHLVFGRLQFMITDSWEAGAQNWTANLPAEFQKRRGYSIISWLPVLTGQTVKSSEASEQFLFDFRKTLSDMVAEYRYDGLTKILAERGMKRYSESHG